MNLTGYFPNKQGKRIYVSIYTDDGTSETININDSASIRFAPDPVEIKTKSKDLFDPIIRSSCTISFVTKEFLGSRFFSGDIYDTRVLVGTSPGSGDIWSGFVEPGSYNQGYADMWETYEVNCIDYLSTLKYYNYKDCKSTNYDSLKQNATIKNFYDILVDMFPYTVAWDKSKSAKDSSAASIFHEASVSEAMFFGESFDDVWTNEEVLEEILQYLNLHIITTGSAFLMFDWNTLRCGSSTGTSTLFSATGSPMSAVDNSNIDLTIDLYASDGTNMSIADVYNKILITCKIEEFETVIENPLDSDALSSPFKNKQLYMREYWSDGEGERAIEGFYALLHNQATGYDACGTKDWYIRGKENKQWSFPNMTQFENNGSGLYVNQWKPLRDMRTNTNKIQCGIYGVGASKTSNSPQDNTIDPKVSMTDCMIISINGNGNDDNPFPTENVLAMSSPIATYKSSTSVNYTPADSSTTNYLVFSGSIILNPIMKYTSNSYYSQASFWDLYDITSGYGASPFFGGNGYWHMTVPSDNNDDGRYYTQRFFDIYNPTVADTGTRNFPFGWYPYTEVKALQALEYTYNENHESIDTISKYDVLECELKIGDKYCVETYNSSGDSVYGWYTLENLPTVKGEKRSTFALGINPKIGDKIIGTKYDIANNITVQMNLGDFVGTAIPIKMSDNVSGDVSFKILGPVNNTFNEVYRRHKTWFRSEKFYDNNKFVLAHTSSIIIEDFECGLTTDNGVADNDKDNDLVYVSEMNDKYLESKDDIEFKIQTPLTTDECAEKGIKNSINISSVLKSNGTGLFSIKDNTTGNEAKPEELYIDQYYKLYFRPRLELQTEIHSPVSYPQFHLWTDDSNGIQYFPIGYRYNAMDDVYQLSLLDNNDYAPGSSVNPIVIYPNKFVTSVNNLTVTASTNSTFTENVATLVQDGQATYSLDNYVQDVGTYKLYLKYKCDVTLEDGTVLTDYDVLEDPLKLTT